MDQAALVDPCGPSSYDEHHMQTHDGYIFLL